MIRKLPSRALDVARRYPKVWSTYEQLGMACAEAGPINKTSRRLVKLAFAVGRGSEGAVHSHVRQALAEGVSPDEIRHVGILAVTTLGFPAAVAALTWIEDILSKKSRSKV